MRLQFSTSDTFNGIIRISCVVSLIVGAARPLIIQLISLEPGENLNDSRRTDKTSSVKDVVNKSTHIPPPKGRRLGGLESEQRTHFELRELKATSFDMSKNDFEHNDLHSHASSTSPKEGHPLHTKSVFRKFSRLKRDQNLHRRVYTRKTCFCDFIRRLAQPPLGFPLFRVFAPGCFVPIST